MEEKTQAERKYEEAAMRLQLQILETSLLLEEEIMRERYERLCGKRLGFPPRKSHWLTEPRDEQ